MPRKCAIPGCSTGYASNTKYTGVSVFRFPKDSSSKQKWLQAIPRSNWEPTPNVGVCSLHFNEGDINTEVHDSNKYRKKPEGYEPGPAPPRLKVWAVPSKFPDVVASDYVTDGPDVVRTLDRKMKPTIEMTESLITQVRIRPQLWNTRAVDYNDIIVNGKTWQQVREAMIAQYGFEALAACNLDSIRHIRLKWRALKNNGSKVEARRRNEPDERLKAKPYMWAKHMAFLKNQCDPNFAVTDPMLMEYKVEAASEPQLYEEEGEEDWTVQDDEETMSSQPGQHNQSLPLPPPPSSHNGGPGSDLPAGRVDGLLDSLETLAARTMAVTVQDECTSFGIYMASKLALVPEELREEAKRVSIEALDKYIRRRQRKD